MSPQGWEGLGVIKADVIQVTSFIHDWFVLLPFLQTNNLISFNHLFTDYSPCSSMKWLKLRVGHHSARALPAICGWSSKAEIRFIDLRGLL